MSEFNLLDEPFLPVEDLDGVTSEVSLRDVFRLAPQLRRLNGDIPTQEFAFLRLLLAVIYDSIHPAPRNWRRMWSEGLPLNQIDAYLQKWRDRFWLFDPARPFMQVAGLHTAKGEASGLEKLIADVPNGEPLFSMRTHEGLARISPAEAARWLVHCQAFDPSGIRSGAVGDSRVKNNKGYPIGPSWAGQLGGLILHGRTLEQTLLLNLVPLTDDMTDDGDRPVWALDQPQTAEGEDFTDEDPPGTVSLLTWQSRRIRLVGDPSGVTGVVLAQGDKMTPQNRHLVEPLSGWRFSEPQTKKLGRPVYMPRKHESDRGMWRSLPTILSDVGEVDGRPRFRSALTIQHLAKVEEQEGIVIPLRLQTVGMTYGTQEATVEDLVNDQMDLAMVLLTTGERGRELRGLIDDAIAAADAVARSIGQLASNLAKASGERGDKAGEGARDAARARFFSDIDLGARRWCGALDADTDRETAMETWHSFLWGSAKSLGRELLDQCGALAAVGRPVSGPGGRSTYMTDAIAERYFDRARAQELPNRAPTVRKDQHERQRA